MNPFKALGALAKGFRGGGNPLDMQNMVKTRAAQMGISPTAIDEFMQEAQAILSNGNLTREEIEVKMTALAKSKGLPSEGIGKALQMLLSQK